MNYILIIGSITAGFFWWSYIQRYLNKRSGRIDNVIEEGKFVYQISGKKRNSLLILFILLIIAGSGSVLFQLYGYGLSKILRYLILMMVIILIAIIDCKEWIIPNQILMKLLLIRGMILIGEWIQYYDSSFLKEIIISPFLGLFLGGGLFFICYMVSRKCIGAGDVKLLAVIGAFTGAGVLIPVMFLSALTSAIYGGIMLITHKLTMKDSIPFAPFVAVGTILTLLLGF